MRCTILVGFACMFLQTTGQSITQFSCTSESSPDFLLKRWLGKQYSLSYGLASASVSTNNPSHHSYFLTYRGVPLNGIMLSRLCKGQMCLVVANELPSCNFETTVSANPQNLFWFYDSSLCLWQLFRVSTRSGFEIRTHIQTNTAQTINRRIFFSPDTLIPARIFNPDPLSPGNFVYGQPQTDAGDSNSNFFEQQYRWIKLPCHISGDSFIPGTTRVQLAAISAPATPKTFTKTSFAHNRSQPSFEDAMAVYHLHRCYQWWDSLGFGFRADTVLVDAHALGGADESAYNPTPNPPTIEWGTGGVDDAEDADALIHEYTHAAIQGALPRSYQGTQRQSIEEGICDFMAVAYSRLWTLNQGGRVYNWDGHNIFWEGRNLENSRTFPASLTNQPHTDGQIFGAALFDLMQECGRDSVVKLLLAAMPLLLPNITMPQAAQLLIKTDSLVFGAKYNWPIVKAFFPRGLLPGLAVHDLTNQKKMQVLNSRGFSMGEKALFWADQPGVINIYTVSGQKVNNLKVSQGWNSLNGNDFQPGIWIFEFNGLSFKLHKAAF